MYGHKYTLIQKLGDVLRMAERSGVVDLILSEDENTVTILFEGGGKRPVCVEADSDTALLRDVLRHI